MTQTATDAQRRAGQMTEAQLKLVLDRLAKQECRKPAKCRRADPRLAYQRTGVNVRIVQPGGTTTDRLLASRNLSPNGICLFDNRFLHVGTECRVTLRRRLGGEEVTNGRVIWCAHVAGTHHAFGVRFAKPVFVKHFLEPAECSELVDHTQIDPAALKGRILLLDDQEMDRMLFAHSLRATGCEVVTVSNVNEAAEQMMVQQVDVVVCDLNLSEKRGEAAIAGFRSAGFKGYVVALTAESDPARLKAAGAAGANDLLQKPYEASKLLSHLAGWLRAAQQSSVYSSLAGQPDSDALLEQYLGQVARIVSVLKKAIEEDDFDQARIACQALKGTGSGYGYALLSEAAGDAVKSLDASQSVKESAAELRLLESVCGRLSAGKPAEADKGPEKKLGDDKWI